MLQAGNILILLLLLSPLCMAAQETPTQIHLWPDGAPGFEDRNDCFKDNDYLRHHK